MKLEEKLARDILTGIILPAVQVANVKTKLQNLLLFTDPALKDYSTSSTFDCSDTLTADIESSIAHIDDVMDDVQYMFKQIENRNKIHAIQTSWQGIKEVLSIPCPVILSRRNW